MLRTFFSTAPSVTQRRRAMPLFERPSAISASTSRSRGRQLGKGIVAPPLRDQLLDERRVDHRAAAGDPLERVHEVLDAPDPALEQVADALAALEQVDRVSTSTCAESRRIPTSGCSALIAPRGVEALGGLRRRHADVHDDEVRARAR